MPIYASRSGAVTAATYDDITGYHVTLNHRDGYSSVYLHMNHFVVSPGQWVNQGEIIGYVGSTGISTGNQLHFGISKDGVCVDPAAYLPLF